MPNDDKIQEMIQVIAENAHSLAGSREPEIIEETAKEWANTFMTVKMCKRYIDKGVFCASSAQKLRTNFIYPTDLKKDYGYLFANGDINIETLRRVLDKGESGLDSPIHRH